MPERPLASVHRLTIALTIFTAIIVIGLLTIGKSNYRYKVSKEQMLSEILAADYLISPDKAKTILSEKDKQVKFIDLRNRYDFNLKHIEGALNIPTHKLLDKETLKLFKDTSFTYVLYGSEAIDANGPWMVLSQMGYPNFKVLKGGFNHFESNKTSPAKYEYDKILSQAELDVAKLQSATDDVTVTKKKKKAKVMLKRVVKAAAKEEGC